MYELEITVTKVLGNCTAHPPMKPGDSIRVWDGGLSIPEGGWICLYALQSLMPLIPAKEREVLEDRDEDWLWRVHHAQCPDPDGRVVFRIDQRQRLTREAQGDADARGVEKERTGMLSGPKRASVSGTEAGPEGLHDLRVVVEEVGGQCTSGMRKGDAFTLRSGRLYIPAGRHFCLYALQAVLPLLPAKQRPLADGDWLEGANRVICPDPAGNVILRIERS
jgi:uncharacterized repeat protein (TIGR04076 family)